MAMSKTSQAYEAISKARLPLIEGVVISIDPSIGSSSSMPGYAIYRAGTLIASGTIQLSIDEEFPLKAQQLAYSIRKLYTEYDPDVLVYEEIAVHGPGRNIASHVTLLKAVGIILSVPGPKYYVGIYPTSWKKLARPTYVKSDEADAIELGYVAVWQAEQIIEEEGKKADRRYGAKKSK